MSNFKKNSLIAALLFSSGIASAIELSNEDSKTYQIKVQEGSTTTNTSINGNSTRMTICNGKCKIEIVDGPTIDVTGASTVRIKDGKFEIKK